MPPTTPLGRAARFVAVFASIVCLAAVLAGCGSSAKSGPAGSSAAPAAAANPVDVKATPAADGEVSKVVTAEGGKLSLKNADGTEFTLKIPPGALLEDQKITMTPATVDGLPFSGTQVGTVQLSPDGLALVVPAKLTISSPDVTAAKGFETAAYGYRGTGQGLYLDAVDIKDTKITFALSHFSGYGAAQATAAEVKTQATHAPANPEDAFRQDLATLQMENRQASLMGDEIDPEFADKTEAILRDWYKNVVAPSLPTTKDCARAPQVFSTATSWMRQVEILGFGDEFKAEEATCWETIAEAQQRCFGGYRAVGGFDKGTHSGDVPDLAEPFTITVTTGPAKTELRFTPESKERGTLEVSGSGPGGAKFTGGGTYTVENPETETPVLNVDFHSKTSIAGISFSTSRKIPIQLVPKGR
jgi:hypothetical protein